MPKKKFATAVSEGIAVGEVFHYIPYSATIPENGNGTYIVETVLAEYDCARQVAALELDSIYEKLLKKDAYKAKIFKAHKDILFDIAVDEDIHAEITENCVGAMQAVNTVYEKYMQMLADSDDELISARVADMHDVKTRLLRCMEGVSEKNLANLDKPVIIVAYDLLPSETATLASENVLGIVTEIGSATSHTAILAKTAQIPALVGLKNALQTIAHGETIILDAVDGVVISDPTVEDFSQYEKKAKLFELEREKTANYISIDARSADGVDIDIKLNIASSNTAELFARKYADGVGLFRTEFVYMGRSTLPTEDEQVAIYKRLLIEFGEKPVTIRTLDIGGDKKLDCMSLPTEENPFLGNRALRFCFSNPEIFKTQLRACLRASVYGNLWLMFPMVTGLDDIHRAKEILFQAKRELEKEGIAYSPTIKIGIMVEIPSVAVTIDLLLEEIDFVSIGTNDLTQYTLAVDRMNPAVKEYYNPYHPAVFRLIAYVIEQCNKKSKPVSVCGELASDILAVPVLLELGLRTLSVASSSLASVKKCIAELSIKDLEPFSQELLTISCSRNIDLYLKERK